MKSRIICSLLFCLFILSSCDKEIIEEFDHPLLALENTTGQWNWINVEGLRCRDNSSTGVSVRLGSKSGKWVFYLQGGGACFTPSTCETNPANYNEADFRDRESQGFYSAGILNNDRTENPIKDWNIVFIPYCTGDVHVGNLEDGVPLGGDEKQQYVGNRNVEIILDYFKPYMEHQDVDEIMVTGISAGGFGTHITYFETKERFPDIKTHLINDSGPLTSDPNVLPGCLNLGLIFLYNIAVPDGFLLCCQPSYGLSDIYTLAAKSYNEDNFGLISYTEDNTIRFFFAAGQNNCTGGEVSGEVYKEGLIHLRENVLKPTGKWSTYYKTGDEHTFIQGDSRFYEGTVENKLLYEWVQDVMNGEVQHFQE